MAVYHPSIIATESKIHWPYGREAVLALRYVREAVGVVCSGHLDSPAHPVGTLVVAFARHKPGANDWRCPVRLWYLSTLGASEFWEGTDKTDAEVFRPDTIEAGKLATQATEFGRPAHNCPNLKTWATHVATRKAHWERYAAKHGFVLGQHEFSFPY